MLGKKLLLELLGYDIYNLTLIKTSEHIIIVDPYFSDKTKMVECIYFIT